jgi:putative cell wall-binding protein
VSIRARLAMVAGASVLLSMIAVAPPATASTTAASQLPALLVEATETTSPAYDRDLFEHWVDLDGDGCNTRYEVLIEESTTPATVGMGCSLTGGTWVSPYDGVTATTPTEIEIDHVVALAEAWRSGASAWSDEQRRSFANDLGVPYALTAASSASNQSKSDKDPAEWLPTNTAYTCEYVIGWTLTKYRWSLAVDAAELSALQTVLSGECGATEVTLPEVMIVVSEEPETPQTDIAAFPTGVTRLAGLSRYDTALAAAQRYAANVPAVFVATGMNFPDALSAASAAARLGGPLLLTPWAEVPVNVLDEIARLSPEKIYVVGGADVVSAHAFDQLASLAATERLAAIDRYGTGLAVVNSAFATATTAIVATGRTYPDALAATGAAGKLGAPVVLVDGTAGVVPEPVLQELNRLGVESIAIAGGTGAVSAAIESHLRSAGFGVSRLAGPDRYGTAAAINSQYFGAGSTDTMFLATGLNFPDALAGAAMAGRLGAPLYVTAKDCVPQSARDAILGMAAAKTVVMGDVGVVSDAAAANLGCLTSSIPTISGTLKVGHILTAQAGTWTPGTSLSYQWLVNGAAVGGGTTLALTSAHQGKTIAVRVTGALAGYVTVVQTSRPTAAVAGADPTPPPPPANPGNTKNCGDFTTQWAAQVWFNTYYPYYGDVAQLDSDGDLVACESLP